MRWGATSELSIAERERVDMAGVSVAPCDDATASGAAIPGPRPAEEVGRRAAKATPASSTPAASTRRLFAGDGAPSGSTMAGCVSFELESDATVLRVLRELEGRRGLGGSGEGGGGRDCCIGSQSFRRRYQ